MPRTGSTSIFVDDQQAEQFSTEVLGFQVKTSTPDCLGERWLSVVAPKTPTGWSRDYGGIDAVFDDSCGNLINLHQD